MQWNFKFYFTSFPIYIDGVLLPLTFMTRIFEILSNHPNLLLYTFVDSGKSGSLYVSSVISVSHKPGKIESNCFCTILALFLGLLGGRVPTIAIKSSLTSSLDRDTENFGLSLFFFFSTTAASQGTLQAAFRVLRFQGLSESSSKMESLILSAASLRSSMSFWRMASIPPLASVSAFWNEITDVGMREDEELEVFGESFMHLRNLWLPHFKRGKEKLWRGLDDRSRALAIVVVWNSSLSLSRILGLKREKQRSWGGMLLRLFSA